MHRMQSAVNHLKVNGQGEIFKQRCMCMLNCFRGILSGVGQHLAFMLSACYCVAASGASILFFSPTYH